MVTPQLLIALYDNDPWIFCIGSLDGDCDRCVFIWPEYNPLAKYGVVISKDGNASPSLDTFEIHLKGQKYPSPDNPGMTGENLVIQYRDLDRDGVEEIVVRSESSKDSRTVIKVLLENNKAVGFHILDTYSMCLGFSKEGFYCP